MKTGVIVARFQTPYLHQGHLDLINGVKAKHNKVVVVLGISPVKGSRRNPFDYHTRERMLKKAFENLVVLPLCNHPSDVSWSQNLDSLLSGTFPLEEFVLYGGRDSFLPSYSGKYETTELPGHGDHNSTELRNHYSSQVFDSVDFRAGILYAYHNQYTKVYPTVDIALFRNDKKEILLGKKVTDRGWRLIGGFCDVTDDSYEMAAKRELMEECGPIESGPMVYEMSRKVDDWRYKREVDKVVTILFSCDYLFGSPTASDDIAEVGWFDLKSLKTSQIVEEHIELINFLTSKY